MRESVCVCVRKRASERARERESERKREREGERERDRERNREELEKYPARMKPLFRAPGPSSLSIY